jgi:hypothetical protein
VYRSIGDLKAKKIGVICEPEIKHFNLKIQKFSFFLTKISFGVKVVIIFRIINDEAVF